MSTGTEVKEAVLENFTVYVEVEGKPFGLELSKEEQAVFLQDIIQYAAEHNARFVALNQNSTVVWPTPDNLIH